MLAEHSGGGISLIVNQLHINCQEKSRFFCPYLTELKERKSKERRKKKLRKILNIKLTYNEYFKKQAHVACSPRSGGDAQLLHQ